MTNSFTKHFVALIILLGTSIDIIAQCNGDITITTQTEIDKFSCSSFEGSLTIEGADIVNLNGLSIMTDFNGSIYIRSTNITSLTGIDNLATFLFIDLRDNSSLLEINLPNLNNESCQFYSNNNTALKSVTLPSLEVAYAIDIRNSPLITEINLPELRQTQLIEFHKLGTIKNITVPKIENTRVLTLGENSDLESIDFPVLESISWPAYTNVFVIAQNNKLKRFGAPEMTGSQAIFSLSENPVLEDVCDILPLIRTNADNATIEANSINTSSVDAIEETCPICPSLELMQDATLCSGPLLLNADDYSKEITWSTNGEGSLTRLNQTQAEDSAYYFPSAKEYSTGDEIELYASIESGTECGTLTDTVIVTINPKTTVDAGNDFFHLTNDAISLNGSVNNANASIWETSGSGTFSDNTKIVTTYMPTEVDKAEGMVKFTLKVPQEEECPEVTDEVLVSLIDCQISIVEKINNNDVELIAINANSKVITSYEWTLGDGKTRKGRVINHTYQNTGSYPVTVTSKSSDKLCNASASTNITIENTTVPTYSFSGNVEVNDNGSVSTLTEGEAILFYLSPLGVYQEKDRVLLNQNGEFTFAGLKEAEYYLAAAPLKSSGLYKRSILTYSTNTTNWADATSYIVDKDIINVNVEITTFTPTLSNPNGGKDTLNGIVYLYANSTKKTSGGSRDIVDNPLPAQHAVMSLYNANGDLLQVTTTDDDGGFELDELDPGLYSMEISYTGTSVIIRQGIRIDGDPNTPEREEIGIPYDEVVASFDGTFSEELENVIYVAYPNPTLTSVFISTSNVTGEVVYELINNHGLFVKSGIGDVKNNCIELDLVGLVAGIYFVTIENKTYKIIKR